MVVVVRIGSSVPGGLESVGQVRTESPGDNYGELQADPGMRMSRIVLEGGNDSRHGGRRDRSKNKSHDGRGLIHGVGFGDDCLSPDHVNYASGRCTLNLDPVGAVGNRNSRIYMEQVDFMGYYLSSGCCSKGFVL